MTRSGGRFAVVLALVAALASASALGQKRRRPRKPPPTESGQALGAAKEELTPAPTPVQPRENFEDVALFRALLWAFEPAPREIRVIAIQDLALLGDPRALNALGTLLHHADPAIARAALEAIAHFQHPRADELLGQVVRSPTQPQTHRLLALEALPFQDSEASRALITEVSTRTTYPTSMRRTARTLIEKMSRP